MSPAVRTILKVTGAVVLGALLLGFAIATSSWGSAALFVAYVGVGVYLVRRTR